MARREVVSFPLVPDLYFLQVWCHSPFLLEHCNENSNYASQTHNCCRSQQRKVNSTALPRSWRWWGSYHPLQAKLFIIPISLAAPVLLESATLADPTLLRRSTTCLISCALSSFDNFTSSNFLPFLSSISSVLIQKRRTPQGMLLFDPAFWNKTLTAERSVNDTLILNFNSSYARVITIHCTIMMIIQKVVVKPIKHHNVLIYIFQNNFFSLYALALSAISMIIIPFSLFFRFAIGFYPLSFSIFITIEWRHRSVLVCKTDRSSAILFVWRKQVFS